MKGQEGRFDCTTWYTSNPHITFATTQVTRGLTRLNRRVFYASKTSSKNL